MFINEALLGHLKEHPRITKWLSDLRESPSQLVVGLSGSMKHLTMATSLFLNRKIIVVSPNLYYAQQLLEDLQQVLEESYVHFFPVDEVVAVERSFSSKEFMAERVNSLMFLIDDRPGILVTTLAGMRRFIPHPEVFKDSMVSVKMGQTLDLAQLTQTLVTSGYTREQLVSKPGEFSVRGSIVDIYPLTNDYPVRLDLFDNEVDSIRYFDPETQRSLENIEQTDIPPTRDQVVNLEGLQRGAKWLERISAETSIEGKTEQFVQIKQRNDFVERTTASWNEGIPTEEVSHYIDQMYEASCHLSDYLQDSDYILIDDYNRMVETQREALSEEAEWILQNSDAVPFLQDVRLGGDFKTILKDAPQHKTYFSTFQKGMGKLQFSKVHAFESRSMQQFFGQIDLFKVEVERWRNQNYTVVVLAETVEKSQMLESLMVEADIPVVVNTSESLLQNTVQIQVGTLKAGFELPYEQFALVTDAEIVPSKGRKKVRKQKMANAERLKSYNELKPGDYVVHTNHGIGQYVGMETLLSGGVHQDYMTILYQNNDKLFIPVTQLDLIQKYVASESKSPKINKLGGSEWSKTKRKVSTKIEDIADELIQLYAEREAEVGYAFSKDDDEQREFEDKFPYAETQDQLRSIQEIKGDMEKPRPMDRLLVGDVGYGKTEVALRAAFKAVKEGKQVAFLVPTTILAQQHYETMMDRFKDFPINIGLMSRFRTKKQQQETIEKLNKGQIDIVVGTHRVLSKDIEFFDLGLLVIDEEQRFGVKHKERLKQLKSEVDVLTLTATPIPRTLHMSMLGVRDLSVIETPPSNRYPVQTYVMERNIGAIRDACEREIARGGQIFYLYNRVDTIEQKVQELKALMPDARITYAHGQMTEVQLENTLIQFINQDYDILVTTTIIETGVDISNVNTLFIENADYMGLSQLYQLRGRVGRSSRVAYAYFMYEPQKILSETSEKRLQAIKDFTELGSGFKIAMRDLSIRGAGNLLGSQQHGYIDSVGFDMYTQMLSEAVNRKRGLKNEISKSICEIDMGIDAYIPNTYIEDERQKIEVYKRIRQLESQEMYDELLDDLIDRFGEYPDEVAHLLMIGHIKMNADLALVDKIKNLKQKIEVEVSNEGVSAYRMEQIFKALSATKLKASIATERGLIISLQFPKTHSNMEVLQELMLFIEALKKERYDAKKEAYRDESKT